VSAIIVRPLEPERLDEFLSFFDRDAFADNAWWSGCFCLHYENPADYEIPDPASPAFGAFRDANRAAKAGRIRAGTARGFLAFRDRTVVGWLNAQPKESYPNPRAFGPGFADAPDGTGMLMCFIVAPGARGQGVATALLRGAIDGFRAQGLKYAQGFARRPDAPSGEFGTFETNNYHGTPSMYAANGFADVGSLGSYAIMRRTL
jgi:GNAT superfamily N-acetyltransferase